MKRKQFRLLCVVLMLFAVGAMSVYAANRKWQTQKAPRAPVAMPMTKIFVPTPEQMKKTKQLGLRMADLRFPHKTDQRPVTLTLFGHYPLDPRDDVRDPAAMTGLNAKPLALTFTFASGKKRFCIIDGVFYQTGSRLPDNSQVARIESRRVLIKRDSETRWVQMSNR